jgi:GNAT superfamily N-acetyltransferase
LVSEQSTNQNNSGFISSYTLGKNDLIREFLLKAGFSGCRLMRCTHYAEWEAYHRIREEQIFKPINLAYDRNHPTLKLDNHFHFVFYKGVEIVSVAYVEFLNDSDASLRTIATDEPYKNQGFAKKLVHLLERWIKYQGRIAVKVHASLRSEGFYRKLGYSEMPFDDESISKDIIYLGKPL